MGLGKSGGQNSPEGGPGAQPHPSRPGGRCFNPGEGGAKGGHRAQGSRGRSFKYGGGLRFKRVGTMGWGSRQAKGGRNKSTGGRRKMLRGSGSVGTGGGADC